MTSSPQTPAYPSATFLSHCFTPQHPSQSPSRHCLMISNQIPGYNGRFRFPRALHSLWYSLERCGIYVVFHLLEWLVMAETPKQISNVNTSASCASFSHRYLLGESKSSGKCNRSSPPDRVDSNKQQSEFQLQNL